MTNFNALAAEPSQCLHDVSVVVPNAVGHLTGNKERGQPKHELFNLEVFFNSTLFDELKDAEEDVRHLAVLFEDGHSLAQVVPQANHKALH